MADTLRHLIYDIKERLNIHSDDTLTSDEHIAHMINQKRATYLKNYISNLRKEVSFEAKQEICLTLDSVPCDEEFEALESKERLPGIIETTGRNLLQGVYLPSISAKWINIIDYDRLPYIKGGRYNKNQIYITISPDRKVLVYSIAGNHLLLEDLKLSIIATNPEEADKLSCNNGGEECDFYDKPYPNSSDLNSIITSEIVRELTIKYRLPTDDLNDSSDNTTNVGMQMNNRDRRRRNTEEDN